MISCNVVKNGVTGLCRRHLLMGHGLHDSDTIYSVETLGIVLNQKQQIAIFDRR